MILQIIKIITGIKVQTKNWGQDVLRTIIGS